MSIQINDLIIIFAFKYYTIFYRTDYPMAPPRLSFFTPSGRFEINERVCVSFSDYHPELWNR